MKPEIFPVSPTIWCVRRVSYLTCSYVVKTDGGPVLVDAGMASDGGDMLLALETLGLAPESIRAVLLTHWHNDHAAGARLIQERTGAPVYYHAADAPFFTRQTARHGLRGWISDLIPEWGLFVLFKGLLGEATPRAVTAADCVTDGQTILDDFEVLETPGHTPGHVSYYYRPEKALFTGDALAVVGGRVHFMARPVTEDLPLARASMVRCLSREIDLLCPGHREPLMENVGPLCREMAAYVEQGGRWPLLG